MHGLRNSRAADLRKINSRIQTRITRQTDGISVPQVSLVFQPHVIWRGRRWILQASLWIKILGPELGLWHKIGYNLCILFIASLRLFELIILPNQYPWMITIVSATWSVGYFSYKTCNAFASFKCFIFFNVYIPIMEFFFSFQQRAAHEVQKLCDACCWNETEENSMIGM